MTKVVCPKCGSSDLSWDGGIATCHGNMGCLDAGKVELTVAVPCNWRGTYPKRVEVTESNPKEG